MCEKPKQANNLNCALAGGIELYEFANEILSDTMYMIIVNMTSKIQYVIGLSF